MTKNLWSSCQAHQILKSQNHWIRYTYSVPVITKLKEVTMENLYKDTVRLTITMGDEKYGASVVKGTPLLMALKEIIKSLEAIHKGDCDAVESVD